MNDVQQKLVERIAIALIDPACPHVEPLSWNEALEVARFIVTGEEPTT